MRQTKQRQLILDIVNNSFTHPTAYDIYLKCKLKIANISLGTVYRNLKTLVELKKIQQIKISNGVDRYDKMIEHIHFNCIVCNKIIDIFDNKIKFNEYINDNRVLNCNIIINGICKECLEEEK